MPRRNRVTELIRGISRHADEIHLADAQTQIFLDIEHNPDMVFINLFDFRNDDRVIQPLGKIELAQSIRAVSERHVVQGNPFDDSHFLAQFFRIVLFVAHERDFAHDRLRSDLENDLNFAVRSFSRLGRDIRKHPHGVEAFDIIIDSTFIVHAALAALHIIAEHVFPELVISPLIEGNRSNFLRLNRIIRIGRAENHACR